MTLADVLVAVGGLIFVILGGLHALFTLLDVRKPRRFAPAADATRVSMIETTVRLTRGRASMWDAWLGFNISHGLGAVVFGSVAMLLALSGSGAEGKGPALLALALVATIYVALALRFWFHLPAIGTGLAAGCFLVAWLVGVLGSGASQIGLLAGRTAAGGVEVYYEVMGRGEPLVLLHGGGLDRRLWDEQMESFGARFRVIRYDAPSHGESPVPNRSFSHTGVLADLLTTLEVERAHLVGHSLGGRTAIDFALEYPERVRSLVLLAPGLSGWQWSNELSERMMTMMRAAAREGPQAAVDLWLADLYNAPAMEQEALRERVRRLNSENARTWVANVRARVAEPPAVDRLGDLAAPTLLLIGSRDVADVRSIADRLAAELPNVERVDLDGVGHLVNLEARTAFETATLDFLARQSSTN